MAGIKKLSKTTVLDCEIKFVLCSKWLNSSSIGTFSSLFVVVIVFVIVLASGLSFFMFFSSFLVLFTFF